MMQKMNRRQKMIAFAAIASAIAATPALAGQSGDQVTISLSGATFMRNFTTSAGISLLTPNTQIDLLSGPAGAPVRYQAASGGTTSVQLAPNNIGVGAVITPNPAFTDPPAGSANYAGLRVEWHEQGSIEGVLELINDQILPVTSVGLTNRNPSTGNPTWVNRNSFTTHPNTLNGYTVNTSTYTPASYNDTNAARPGLNIQGGQNRVQMAISDVNSRQGFAVGSSGSAAWHRQPGQEGYGRGNQGLALAAPGNIQGLGFANVRHELNNGSVANMNATDINPNTGAAYGAGPWNSAGNDNLHNTTVANGGLTFIANPGTGLTRVNRTNGVWLHATGRLANGADFNVATRDEFSGTINTGVTNIGLDVSWATGENDNGNGNGAGGGTSQTRIGPDMKFSNKTSGSSQVRPTVQNSRMGFGHLTSSESVPESFNSRSRPVRVMEYRDDDDDLANGSNNALPAERRNNAAFADPITGSDATKDIINGFTRMTAKSLVEGSYVLRTNQTYVTVKDPKAAFAGHSAAAWAALSDDIVTGSGIKGDNHNVVDPDGGGPLPLADYGNDVHDFRKNILDAVANFPASSVANPADELLARGFILPAFVKNTKNVDGLNQDFANPAYNSTLSSAFLGSTYVTAFDSGDPRLVMQGNSSTYGNNNIGTGTLTPVGGTIAITSNNWLFGDFDQTGAKKGIRDFSDLSTAQQAQAALFASGLSTDWNVTAGSNGTPIIGAPAQLGFAATKGDLIVLGDYDSDGDFDGQDLYRFARGAALADSIASTTLTAASGAEFGDMIRNGVVRKNAALDQLDSTATAQQKLDARANATNDPTGVNAFNKRDVNRDGLVNFVDAVTSDKFFGKDYRNLGDQLAATGDMRVGDALTPIALVNAELTDTGTIDQADLDVINPALGGFGSETWTGTLLKTGAGTVSTAYVPGGVMKVNTGAALKIDAGTVSVGGTADMFTDNTGTATNGNHLAIENNAGFAVTAGGKGIATLTGSGTTTVSGGGTLTSDYVRQAGLSVTGAGSSAVVRTNGNNASIVTTLSITGGGKVDLGDNDLIVKGGTVGSATGGTYAGVSGLIQAGANFGTWDGPGLMTSRPDAAGGLTALGTATGEQVLGLGPTDTGTWNGQTVSGADVLVMYTYAGDANLDGFISGDDYAAIDLNVAVPNSDGWYNGDFNWDGIISGDDYAAIDLNIVTQGAPLGSGGVASSLGLTAVPEPASAGLIFLSAASLSLARRRERRRRRA